MTPRVRREARTITLRLRVSPAERDALYEASEACRMTFSEWARRCLEIGANQAGVHVPPLATRGNDA